MVAEGVARADLRLVVADVPAGLPAQLAGQDVLEAPAEHDGGRGLPDAAEHEPVVGVEPGHAVLVVADVEVEEGAAEEVLERLRARDVDHQALRAAVAAPGAVRDVAAEPEVADLQLVAEVDGARRVDAAGMGAALRVQAAAEADDLARARRDLDLARDLAFDDHLALDLDDLGHGPLDGRGDRRGELVLVDVRPFGGPRGGTQAATAATTASGRTERSFGFIAIGTPWRAGR